MRILIITCILAASVANAESPQQLEFDASMERMRANTRMEVDRIQQDADQTARDGERYRENLELKTRIEKLEESRPWGAYGK